MRSVLFLVVVGLVGACSAEAGNEPTIIQVELGRTAGDVYAEGSCGCSAGYSLRCTSLDGFETELSPDESCFVVEKRPEDLGPGDLRFLIMRSGQIEMTCDYERREEPDFPMDSNSWIAWDQAEQQRMRASLYCAPL